ncbi:hypothetical protein HDE_01641 [Halotydeus destructor]|nr:hypothetical protein HDE_01641 [Halotydeus destructor]
MTPSKIIVLAFVILLVVQLIASQEPEVPSEAVTDEEPSGQSPMSTTAMPVILVIGQVVLAQDMDGQAMPSAGMAAFLGRQNPVQDGYRAGPSDGSAAVRMARGRGGRGRGRGGRYGK